MQRQNNKVEHEQHVRLPQIEARADMEIGNNNLLLDTFIFKGRVLIFLKIRISY